MASSWQAGRGGARGGRPAPAPGPGPAAARSARVRPVRGPPARPRRAVARPPGPASEEDAASKRNPLQVDRLIREELRENGFRSLRRTKIACTIGPASGEYEQLETLAANGMNVARLNMVHADHAWHRKVIRSIKRLNETKGYCVASE